MEPIGCSNTSEEEPNAQQRLQHPRQEVPVQQYHMVKTQLQERHQATGERQSLQRGNCTSGNSSCHPTASTPCSTSSGAPQRTDSPEQQHLTGGTRLKLLQGSTEQAHSQTQQSQQIRQQHPSPLQRRGEAFQGIPVHPLKPLPPSSLGSEPVTGAEAQGTKRDDTIPAALAEVSPEASSGKHQQYRQHQVLRPLQEGRCDAGAVLKAPTSYCVNRGTMPPTTVGLTPAVTTETPVWSVAPFSARSSLGAVGSDSHLEKGSAFLEAAAITRGKKAPAFSPVIEAARTALPSPLLSASSVNVMASRSPHEQKQYTHLCQPPQSVRLSPSFRRNRRSPSSRHVRAASSDWSTTNNHGKRVAEPARSAEADQDRDLQKGSPHSGAASGESRPEDSSTLSETPLSLLSPSGRRYCLLRPHQKTLFGPLYEGMLLLGGTSRNSRNSCRFQRVAIKAVDKKLVQLQLDQAQAAAAGTSLSPGTAAAAAAIGSNKELYLLLHLVPETPLAEVFFSTRLQGVPHVHTLTEV
ncbi:hypothetical protein cyc_04370 [Cyclospora cayetanensis]|uniref:Uncharacterized protein n=1 Tax=Cyclospora cayetanensis TaxID=88456 RepID=A0A1D3CY32_9EIME|nr:hypothetical protein cyc_04370 [Cyclospora cayetanensis]